MKKRVIAFYDVLLYTIICGPLIVLSFILMVKLVTLGTYEWIYKNWHLVVVFAVSFVLPIAGTILFRYCVIENNTIYFRYFPFTTSWERAGNNIDIRWNQKVLASEVKDIQIVKLTEEQKETKVFYRHWFNKYLKVNMKYGRPKYIYVGNYSSIQINNIVNLIMKLSK